MNIKQIIREEVDDFDWIRGVSPETKFTDLNVGDEFIVTEISDYGNAMFNDFFEGEEYKIDIITSTVFKFDGTLDVDSRVIIMGRGNIIRDYGYAVGDKVYNILLHDPVEDFYLWVDGDMVKINKVN